MQYRLAWTECVCFKCGNLLKSVEPPIDGWKYYCPFCCHLTQERTQLMVALSQLAEGALGIVAAVPIKFLAGPTTRVEQKQQPSQEESQR